MNERNGKVELSLDEYLELYEFQKNMGKELVAEIKNLKYSYICYGGNLGGYQGSINRSINNNLESLSYSYLSKEEIIDDIKNIQDKLMKEIKEKKETNLKEIEEKKLKLEEKEKELISRINIKKLSIFQFLKIKYGKEK